MGDGIDKIPGIKIKPPENGVYQGAFLGDDVSASDIDDFQKMSGTDVDITLKFLAFTTGLDFPESEAKTITEKGGTIFIKLEPWSWNGKDDSSYTLEDIIAGKHDKLLQKFAKGAIRFGKPAFISFGHEMNGNWYPWSGNPELYVKAYRYVVDFMIKEGANNLTWVWNPNIDFSFDAYYPGDEYVDWVALDGYNTEDWGGPWRTGSQLFSSSLDQISIYNKPIMIGEFASDANNNTEETTDKPQWLKECIDYFVQSGKVKAFIYFNTDKRETGGNKEWAIDKQEAKQAYRQAIKDHEQTFKDQILTSAAPAPTLAAASVPDPIPTPVPSPTPKDSLITWETTLFEEFDDQSNNWQEANWSNGGRFKVRWQPDNVNFDNGTMTLALDKQGCPQECDKNAYASGEYRTNKEYGYGYYEARMKPAKGEGLNSSFFIYYADFDKNGKPIEATHDEIDFEFLGKDTTKVQVNYYVNGVGEGKHEFIVDLGFDASKEFHNYAFLWTKEGITWFVDGKPVYSTPPDTALPTRPGKIMVNLWTGTNEKWLGKFTYPGSPVKAEYDWIKYSTLEQAPKDLKISPVIIKPVTYDPKDMKPITLASLTPIIPGLLSPDSIFKKAYFDYNETEAGLEIDPDIPYDKPGRLKPYDEDTESGPALFNIHASNYFISLSKSDPAQDAKLGYLFERARIKHGPRGPETFRYNPIDFAEPYFLAKTISILVNNVKSEYDWDQLMKLLAKAGLASNLTLTPAEVTALAKNGIPNIIRFKILEALEKYSENKLHDEHLLRGEIYYFLSLYAAESSKAGAYRNEATREYLYVTSPNERPQRQRMLAEISYIEAMQNTDPEIKLRALLETLTAISVNLPGLDGMELVAAEQTIAAILVDLAYLIIRKPSLKNILLDNFKELKDCAAGENRDDYENILMRWAKEHIDNILQWQKKYNAKLNSKNPEATEASIHYSKWLKQIVVQAKISDIKIRILKKESAADISRDVDILNTTFNNQQRLGLGQDLALFYLGLKEENKLSEATTCYELAHQLLLKAKEEEMYPAVAAQALLWLGKIEAVSAERDEKALIDAGKRIFEARIALTALPPDERVSQDIAEANRVLAEIKARLAFQYIALRKEELAKKLLNGFAGDIQALSEDEKTLLEALGTTGAIKLFEDASETENDYTKASSFLWLAKIYAFKASYEDNNSFLDTAKGYLIGALATTKKYGFILSGSELSAAYQVEGDIAITENRFDDAVKQYKLAIGTWTYNFDARNSLGDVLGWQNSYSEATKEYDYVLKNAKPNSSEYFRARLGLADLESYQLEYKTAKTEYEKILGEIDALQTTDLEIERLGKRAQLGIYETLIRNEDYSKLDEANAFVAKLIKEEPAGSSILIRAMQFALELADAYYSVDNVTAADTLVAVVKNDSRSSDILKLKARLREARRFSFLGEKKDANKIYKEIVDQYKTKELNKLTVEELSMLAEASLNFEYQINDPDDRHYEYIKAIFTELLARRPTTRQRMRIYLDYAAFISHADDEKLQKKAAKLFKHVIMQYLDGIYKDLLPSELKKSERFLLAEAYYGLAELKRWGEDKDLDTAEKYYHSAMVALVRKEDGSNKDKEGIKNDTRAVKDLRSRALFGRSQAYEAMGSGIRAQQDSEAAYGLKKEISAQNRDDLRVFRSRVYPKLISVSEKCIKNSKNEQECREQLGASLPVPGTDGRAEVGVTQNFDRDGKDKTIASTNITAKAHAELGKTTQLDVETQVKVNQTQNKDGRTELLRQPDILTTINLRNQYVNAMLATTHDIQYPEYNISKFLNLSSVYGSATLNLSGFTDLPIISGLGIGADYNYYTFLYEGSQKERQNISLSLRANWDVGRIARDFGWYPRWLPEGLLNLRFYSNWPYYEWMAYKDYSNHENATGTQGTFHALRGKVGGGATLNLYRWTPYLPFTVDFNVEYSRQFSHVARNIEDRRFVEKDYKQTSYDVTLWLNVPEAVEWLKHPYLKKPDPSEKYYEFYNPDFPGNR